MKMNMTLAAGAAALASLVAFGDIQYGTVHRIDVIEQQAAANSSRVYGWWWPSIASPRAASTIASRTVCTSAIGCVSTAACSSGPEASGGST